MNRQSAALADPLFCPNESTQRDYFQTKLAELRQSLLSHDSATAALEQWCRRHCAGPTSTVFIERLPILTAEGNSRPQALSGAAIRHRRVRLRYQDHILSEADNWYDSDCLTAEMNERLDVSDEAFGRIVQSLAYRRQTRSAHILWDPMRLGADDSPSSMAVPVAILRHEALLLLPDGTAFCEVMETYRRDLLVMERQ